MGNTPSHHHGSPRHQGGDHQRLGGRNPNLKVPIPPVNPNNISPSHSNPASPSGRAGSPRRRKSLELPDMNKLSFTPAAAVPTTATNTSHHLAPSTVNGRAVSASTGASGSSSAPKRWQQIMGGTRSPLTPTFGGMTKLDPVTLMPIKTTSQTPVSPSKATSATPVKGDAPAPSPTPQGYEVPGDGTVSVTVHWTGSGKVVQLVGDFADNWKGRIPMVKGETSFSTVLRLKPGQYRLKFIVDDSWRCSKDIPTATDEDGTFVNWLEVEAEKTEEEAKAAWSMDADPPARPLDDSDAKWTNEIPDPIVLYQYIEELPHTFEDDYSYQTHVRSAYISPVPQPPMLPRILERVIVNNDSAMHHDSKHMPRWDHVSPAGLDDNSILAVPNHVVLNHLTASAIKNGTLGVGTTTRYRKKYITTMFFKPTPADMLSSSNNPRSPAPSSPSTFPGTASS